MGAGSQPGTADGGRPRPSVMASPRLQPQMVPRPWATGVWQDARTVAAVYTAAPQAPADTLSDLSSDCECPGVPRALDDWGLVVARPAGTKPRGPTQTRVPRSGSPLGLRSFPQDSDTAREHLPSAGGVLGLGSGGDARQTPPWPPGAHC